MGLYLFTDNWSLYQYIFNIKFLLRSVILVVFFLTFVSKIVILPFLITDDLRRSFIWIKRKLKSKPRDEKSVDSNNQQAIPRSEFIIKAGTLIAALPLASLTYGVVSSAYDYRIKRKTLFYQTFLKLLMELLWVSSLTFTQEAFMIKSRIGWR